MRRTLLALNGLLFPFVFASPALAGNWGEDWGSMIWVSVAALPSLEGVGVGLLVISLFGAAAWRLRRRSIHASLMLVLIPLVPFLMAPHYTDWNGFTNGTVAESAVMNENFTTMQGGVNASNTANPVSVPYTFTNATPADADQVNENFKTLEEAVTTALANRATDCAGAGGTWDAGTSTCTPAYNCYIGGFCAGQTASVEGLPPGSRVWEPAAVAACQAEPGYGDPPFDLNAWDMGSETFDGLGPGGSLNTQLGYALTDSWQMFRICLEGGTVQGPFSP